MQNAFPYDLKIIEEVNRDATENAAAKRTLYLQALESVKKAKNIVQVCVSNEEKAKTQAFITGQLVRVAAGILTEQQDLVNKMQMRLKDAHGRYLLKKAAYDQAESFAKSAKKVFDLANNTFNESIKALSNATSQFITAQT